MAKPKKHRRTKPKQGRAGCMLCKPQKNSHNTTADGMRSRALLRQDVAGASETTE